MENVKVKDRFVDEKTGIEYIKQGDYYLPNLVLAPEETNYTIGKYGRMKLDYLKKHKKVLKRAKGYYGAKHYRFRQAKQAVMKSGAYAYVGRKDRKSDFRKLWIARINAAARMNDMTYSTLIAGLKKANITINRKMLAELAVTDANAFAEVCKLAKNA